MSVNGLRKTLAILAAGVCASAPNALGAGATTPSGAQGKFTAAQYQKALWMTTRFFGAERSGAGPNWAIQDTKYPTSFVKDSYLGKDVSGGWFDCGDHVMFGQTQFFAAYIMAKALATYPTGFPDLYHGDYSDYKQSQDYSIAGGTPNGMQDLLEELRYEADFFVKATPDAQTFIYQKGSGGPDHKHWVHPGFMSTLSQAEGGEADKSRAIFPNPKDGSMPGQCAAMLAVMARLDPDTARRSLYLEHAKYAFQYALGQTGTVQDADGGTYYAAINTAADGVVDAKLNAAVELWLTTNDNTYKTQAQTFSATVAFNSYWGMDWANQAQLGVFNAKYVLGATMPKSGNKDLVAYLGNAADQVDAKNNNVSLMFANGFPLRGPENYALLEALVQAQTKDYSADQFILDQIDYMLGANSKNQAYLVGWDEGNKLQPTKPHNRTYYMSENPSAVPGEQTPPAKNKYFGVMVPGALDGSYTANVLNYAMNEGCLEQNAPVVAALGYILSRVAPVDTSKFNPHTGTISVRNAPGLLKVRSVGSDLVLAASKPILNLKISDLQGRSLFEATPNTNSYRWKAPRSGMVVVEAHTAQGWSVQKVLLQP